MKYTQEEEGFSASKSEYERQLKVWGYRKNATQDIWKFIHQKLKEREAQGKQSHVYLYGKMIDMAAVRRHTNRVSFTSIESSMISRPKTPDNVAVIPPVSPLYLETVKSNRLPWQHFCELVELQAPLDITIQQPSDMRRKIVPYLVPEPISVEEVPKISKRIVDYLYNIMPLENLQPEWLDHVYDKEVYSKLNLMFADNSKHSTREFLRLTVYVLSNKLLLSDRMRHFQSGVKTISDEILKWFQMGNNRVFLRAILSIKTPSIDAFAETIFCSAIEDEDPSMVRIFLESGVDPNTFVEESKRGHSLTPLQFTACIGNVEMVKFLLEYGADTNARSSQVAPSFREPYETSHKTPLQIAAQTGNLELVKLLITAGAVINTDASFGSSALQHAAQGQHYEIVQLLLDAKADINTSFGQYGCALECAIRKRSTRLTELLLNNGADVNSSGGDNLSPLRSAVIVNDQDMVSYLLKCGAQINTTAAEYSWHRPGGSKNCLQWAVKNGNKNIISLLLNHGEDINGVSLKEYETTALTVAVEESNYEMIGYLLSAGANVNDCRGEKTALETAIERKDAKIISILLEAGADSSLDCSISLAAKASNIDLVSVLLGRGANINKESWSIPTALYQAVEAKSLVLVQFLLRYGADPNFGIEIMNALIQAGCNCNKASNH